MAISVTQRTTNGDSAGSTGHLSLVFGSNNTATNTVMVCVAITDSTQALFRQEARPPTDTNSNIYYHIFDAGYNSTAGTGLRWYAAYNIASGANTITIQDNGNEAGAIAYEVAGLPSYASFDKSTSQILTSNANFDSTSTATTSYSNEILLGGFSYDVATAITAGTNYSNVQYIANGGPYLSTEERIVSSTGVYNATASHAGLPSSISSIVTFADTAITTKVATITNLGTTLNTNSGSHTVTATPAANDLIIIVRAATGSTTSTPPTDNNSDGNGTYTLAASSLKATSADLLEIWVRNFLIGSASSTVFTEAPGTTSGGGLTVYKATGMARAGAMAIKQRASQDNQSANATPALTFSGNIAGPNPVIGAVFNATSSTTAANTHPPILFAQGSITGYSTPTTGLTTIFNNGGSTGTTITWGAQSPSAFCSAVIELDTSALKTRLPGYGRYLTGGNGASTSGRVY